MSYIFTKSKVLITLFNLILLQGGYYVNNHFASSSVNSFNAREINDDHVFLVAVSDLHTYQLPLQRSDSRSRHLQIIKGNSLRDE